MPMAWHRCLLPRKLNVDLENFSPSHSMWPNIVLGAYYFSGDSFVSILQLLSFSFLILIYFSTSSCWPVCVPLNSLTTQSTSSLWFFLLLQCHRFFFPLNFPSHQYCPFDIAAVIRVFVEVWRNCFAESEEGIIDFTGKEKTPKDFIEELSHGDIRGMHKIGWGRHFRPWGMVCTKS